MLLGRTQIIEIVNLAITQSFGYTPEQLLGQTFTIILSEGQKEEISHQLTLMRLGQITDQYEGHTVCITDSNDEIPCTITILGMRRSANEELNNYVIVLRDETLLLKQQHEAEEAKAKSEELLYQILPRDIVIRLSSGEKDVTFTIQSATIMFIDIVKFSNIVLL